jgi:ribosomal RNA-processing protein 1
MSNFINDQVDIKEFARLLASNKKKERDNAMKDFKNIFGSKKQQTEMEHMKIWKGLFYCMWMSDKPLVQEDLAERMASLIYLFEDRESSLLFIKCFWQTMKREWYGIDRIRLNKYYILFKRIIFHTFRFLEENQWIFLDTYNRIMENILPDLPKSIFSYICENYLNLLVEAVELPTSFSTDAILIFQPFAQIARGKDKTMKEKIINEILKPLVGIPDKFPPEFVHSILIQHLKL